MSEWKEIEGVFGIESKVDYFGNVSIRQRYSPSTNICITFPRERPALMKWAEEINYGVFDGRKPEPRRVSFGEYVELGNLSGYRICDDGRFIKLHIYDTPGVIHYDKTIALKLSNVLRDFAYGNIVDSNPAPSRLTELKRKHAELSAEIEELEREES